MSQSTPTATPSRRRGVAPETPSSVRSNTSTTMDRSTLLERVESLDLEVHDLCRSIAAEREKRRNLTARQREKAPSLQLDFLDPEARGRDGIKQSLLEKLRTMDDDALTSLLVAGTDGVARWISSVRGGNDGVWGGVDVRLLASKSVGVEGTGSGSDIDRRLKLQCSDINRQGKDGVEADLAKSRHAASVNEYLKDRQRRSAALVESLLQFSHLDIDTLEQRDTGTDRHGRRSRSIHMAGSVARLLPLDVRFDVVEDSSSPSPQIQNLQVKLPTWLKDTLNAHHSLFNRLIKRNDLPAILLMLRTMIPLISLRRNLYTALMEQYTDLVRDHVRAWEKSTGVDFAPWHPPSSSSASNTSRKRPAIDETLASSLIAPSTSETLVLSNRNSATLTFRFTIAFNRFGHATPALTAIPSVPTHLSTPTASTFLETFEAEFQHLLKTAIAQDAIVTLPDHDNDNDDDLDPVMGRWGVLPAISAVIKAFFALESGESASERGDSSEDQ